MTVADINGDLKDDIAWAMETEGLGRLNAVVSGANQTYQAITPVLLDSPEVTLVAAQLSSEKVQGTGGSPGVSGAQQLLVVAKDSGVENSGFVYGPVEGLSRNVTMGSSDEFKGAFAVDLNGDGVSEFLSDNNGFDLKSQSLSCSEISGYCSEGTQGICSGSRLRCDNESYSCEGC